MNKQELNELLEKEINDWTEFGKKLVHRGEFTKCERVTSHIDGLRFGLSILKSLDDSKTQQEPQKVVVPQFVADWYEEHKHRLELRIFCLVIDCYRKNTDGRNFADIEKWMDNSLNNPIETLIRMKDGYEVEKESLYRVELPQFHFNEEAGELQTVSLCLAWDFQSDETRLISFVGSNTTRFKTNLTEKEIKSIDDRFWAFAVPVEEG